MNDDDKPVGPAATTAVVHDLALALTAWTREPGFAEECGDEPCLFPLPAMREPAGDDGLDELLPEGAF